MVSKGLIVAGGLFCAAGTCQFPEYYQQYTQRLAGAVDELSTVVEMFDADAAAMELTREAALQELEGAGGMAAARALSMRRVFDRYDRLSSDLNVLRSRDNVARVIQAWRMTDMDVAKKTWEDFRPAVPVTAEGIGFGLAGFFGGSAVLSLLLMLGRGVFRRGRAAQP